MKDTQPGISDLQQALQAAREAMVWKLDGLSDYDVRRPLTPTSTNLLGLVKHLTTVEMLYLGFVFDRPVPSAPDWLTPDAARGDDLWARPEESRSYIIGSYQRAWSHADETIESADANTTADVPWVPFLGLRCPLNRVVVHVLTETYRHLGHADIVRELVDGSVGKRRGEEDMASTDPSHWTELYRSVETAARTATQP